ncbi:Anaphase-promoting complex subunit 2 [Psilocybe cubensis]|uniref:Anaphase-promoting complex subunit 2 n=2 Tax=Psilocybe cubensis TaxID=181762 RepID=A0ACB8GZI9_PSICU|nr:Anaphase-promoting complex subunit 2 [Psilocybe cubensis]KAH9480869.1 Anaphase-promoting complex subunit 2 [Psilocybe cubensis]
MATDALRSQVAAKWQESFHRLNSDAPGISGLMNFSEAWAISTQYLYPWDINNASLDGGGKPFGKDLNVARPAFSLVNHSRRLPALLENFLDDMRQNFYLIENEINQFMERYEADEDTAEIDPLITKLMEWYKSWAPPQELGSTFFSSYTLNFQTRLFSALPPSFAHGFKKLCARLLSPPDDDHAQWDPNIHAEVWKNFEILGLIDRYESIIASVGYEFIENHVLSKCTGEWGKPMLEELRVWMSEKVVPWMLHVYARGASNAEEARSMLQGVGSRFDFHINKTLCDLRTREIFDIIIDFPDSMGALQDLKDCLQRVDQRANLVRSLRKSNQKRLLHPGADTKLILQQYVATIKCLRIVDPPGVLLFKVADPIRRYLRERPDTIRSIVANLVGDDDGGDSLVDENEPIQPLQQPEFEDYTDPQWEPEPIDAGPEFRTNKPGDILSTLVSIYDSKDLFVKELQVLLAQRLLMITKDNSDRVERERKNVEILKIRFGEAALQVCEVMLRDMTDSKRIDGHVQSQKESVVHPTIISRHFWPSLESSDMVMPGQFKQLQEDYAHEFNVFKPDKTLKWLPHLGTVQLELELEDRTIEVDVPPLEAAFIELFADQAIWTLDELVKAVGAVDRSAAIKALSTWVDHGVLKEDPENTFRLLERAEEPSEAVVRERDLAALPVVEDTPAISVAQQQQADQMRVYWKFIEGMLTNLEKLPLDRIQSMLKFAPGYDRSIEQLGDFMEAARREGLVVVRDGIWKLNK